MAVQRYKVTWWDARSKTKFTLGKALKPSILSKRTSKHKYDILKRPIINELAERFNKKFDFASELDFTILEKGIKTLEEL